MGVDARMFAIVPVALSDEALRHVAVLMQSRIRNAGLRCDPIGRYSRPPHHCLERAALADLPDNMIAALSERSPLVAPHVLHVLWWQSYYGPRYERGDLPEILAVARFLRTTITAEIWYGGDDRATLLTTQDEHDLWAHFISLQGADYFAKMGHPYEQTKVRCDFCNLDCANNSSNGSRQGWYCVSCGRHWVRDGKRLTETRADYKTPVEVGESEFARVDTLSLPRARLNEILRAIDDGNDPRHALIELRMLVDEFERNPE